MTNWILKLGTKKIDCDTFPFAFRTAFNAIEAGIKNKMPIDPKTVSIQGPAGPRGDRTIYSYAAATELAKSQGLLNDGKINAKEFKRRR